MSEIVTFDVPIQAEVRTVRIAGLMLDWAALTITVILREWSEAGGFIPGGKQLAVGWIGNDAYQKMVALNKANLSTKSLHQRVIEALLADGKISGAVASGTVP